MVFDGIAYPNPDQVALGGLHPRIDAGRLKAHEARRWSALRSRTRLLVCDALSADDSSKQKALLDRRVVMLTKLAQRGNALSEELGGWVGRFDTDADTDTDVDTDSDTDAVGRRHPSQKPV
jgi:hypothetical protein